MATQTNEPQAYTVVVTDVDSFKNWAEQQKIQVLGTFRPANIVELQTTARFFKEKILHYPKVLFAAPAACCPHEEFSVPG